MKPGPEGKVLTEPENAKGAYGVGRGPSLKNPRAAAPDDEDIPLAKEPAKEAPKEAEKEPAKEPVKEAPEGPAKEPVKEPPVTYPGKEDLSERRKERFSATDLARHAAEKRIEEALKSPTVMEFKDTPLDQVIDYLRDYHKIEIQFDKSELEKLNVDPSTPVTKNLKGISLRSALRLLLDNLGLKYVIHSDVLLITSPQKAERGEFLATKVYPVTDLTLPRPDYAAAGKGCSNTSRPVRPTEARAVS